jgi:hypothetical protein
MKTKTTSKVSALGIFLLFFSFFLLLSVSSYAQTGGNGCDNESAISGNVKSLSSNQGVSKSDEIKDAPNNKGAEFYDNNDNIVAELKHTVPAGKQVVVFWKRRNYTSTFPNPAKLEIYESANGTTFSYNTTLTTTEITNYIQGTVTLAGNTKFLKLRNPSSSASGSPDFLVDAITYAYTICNDPCQYGPEQGTPCDDGNPATSNDVINSNCECEGSATGCDDETTTSGNVKSLKSNQGVSKSGEIKDAPNNKGAEFYDNNDNIVAELKHTVAAGKQVVVFWKRRNYTSTFANPAKLEIYESTNGNSYIYNTTLTTSEITNYIQGTVTLSGNTKFLKLVNPSSSASGSPDFLVDAITYAYTICNDLCQYGPEPGMPCDDGNANTSNDVVNANCECVGEIAYDCPAISANIGDACNDNNANTANDVITANCECVGVIVYDCPALSANIGDACDDGDANTSNDVITANCECVGVIVYDCPALSANIGDACDDGDANTSNDVVNANCECVGGIVYDCPALFANIGDPCNDNNANTANDVITSNCECIGVIVYDCPAISANFGDACDDGNANTSTDVIGENCECAGVIVYDCPAIPANIGDACNDGDANTLNDVINANCECAGTPILYETISLCVQVNDRRDDAEENLATGSVSTTSDDLELMLDGPPATGPFINQKVGIRFNGHNIPKGVIITSATIQFTANVTLGINPCNLNIRGEASDNAAAFAATINNISSRPVTSSSVLWSPPNWMAGNSGAAQQPTTSQRSSRKSLTVKDMLPATPLQ